MTTPPTPNGISSPCAATQVFPAVTQEVSFYDDAHQPVKYYTPLHAQIPATATAAHSDTPTTHDCFVAQTAQSIAARPPPRTTPIAATPSETFDSNIVMSALSPQGPATQPIKVNELSHQTTDATHFSQATALQSQSQSQGPKSQPLDFVTTTIKPSPYHLSTTQPIPQFRHATVPSVNDTSYSPPSLETDRPPFTATTVPFHHDVTLASGAEAVPSPLVFADQNQSSSRNSFSVTDSHSRLQSLDLPPTHHVHGYTGGPAERTGAPKTCPIAAPYIQSDFANTRVSASLNDEPSQGCAKSHYLATASREQDVQSSIATHKLGLVQPSDAFLTLAEPSSKASDSVRLQAQLEVNAEVEAGSEGDSCFTGDATQGQTSSRTKTEGEVPSSAVSASSSVQVQKSPVHDILSSPLSALGVSNRTVPIAQAQPSHVAFVSSRPPQTSPIPQTSATSFTTSTDVFQAKIESISAETVHCEAALENVCDVEKSGIANVGASLSAMRVDGSEERVLKPKVDSCCENAGSGAVFSNNAAIVTSMPRTFGDDIAATQSQDDLPVALASFRNLPNVIAMEDHKQQAPATSTIGEHTSSLPPPFRTAPILQRVDSLRNHSPPYPEYPQQSAQEEQQHTKSDAPKSSPVYNYLPVLESGLVQDSPVVASEIRTGGEKLSHLAESASSPEFLTREATIDTSRQSVISGVAGSLVGSPRPPCTMTHTVDQTILSDIQRAQLLPSVRATVAGPQRAFSTSHNGNYSYSNQAAPMSQQTMSTAASTGQVAGVERSDPQTCPLPLAGSSQFFQQASALQYSEPLEGNSLARTGKADIGNISAPQSTPIRIAPTSHQIAQFPAHSSPIPQLFAPSGDRSPMPMNTSASVSWQNVQQMTQSSVPSHPPSLSGNVQEQNVQSRLSAPNPPQSLPIPYQLASAQFTRAPASQPIPANDAQSSATNLSNRPFEGQGVEPSHQNAAGFSTAAMSNLPAASSSGFSNILVPSFLLRDSPATVATQQEHAPLQTAGNDKSQPQGSQEPASAGATQQQACNMSFAPNAFLFSSSGRNLQTVPNGWSKANESPVNAEMVAQVSDARDNLQSTAMSEFIGQVSSGTDLSPLSQKVNDPSLEVTNLIRTAPGTAYLQDSQSSSLRHTATWGSVSGMSTQQQSTTGHMERFNVPVMNDSKLESQFARPHLSNTCPTPTPQPSAGPARSGPASCTPILQSSMTVSSQATAPNLARSNSLPTSQFADRQSTPILAASTVPLGTPMTFVGTFSPADLPHLTSLEALTGAMSAPLISAEHSLFAHSTRVPTHTLSNQARLVPIPKGGARPEPGVFERVSGQSILGGQTILGSLVTFNDRVPNADAHGPPLWLQSQTGSTKPSDIARSFEEPHWDGGAAAGRSEWSKSALETSTSREGLTVLQRGPLSSNEYGANAQGNQISSNAIYSLSSDSPTPRANYQCGNEENVIPAPSFRPFQTASAAGESREALSVGTTAHESRLKSNKSERKKSGGSRQWSENSRRRKSSDAQHCSCRSVKVPSSKEEKAHEAEEVADDFSGSGEVTPPFQSRQGSVPVLSSNVEASSVISNHQAAYRPWSTVEIKRESTTVRTDQGQQRFNPDPHTVTPYIPPRGTVTSVGGGSSIPMAMSTAQQFERLGTNNSTPGTASKREPEVLSFFSALGPRPNPHHYPFTLHKEIIPFAQETRTYAQRDLLSRPPMTSQQPPMTSQQPPMTSQKPLMTSQQPLMTSQQPPMTSQQPPMTSQQPPMTSQQPLMTSQAQRDTTLRQQTGMPSQALGAYQTASVGAYQTSLVGTYQAPMTQVFPYSQHMAHYPPPPALSTFAGTVRPYSLLKRSQDEASPDAKSNLTVKDVFYPLRNMPETHAATASLRPDLGYRQSASPMMFNRDTSSGAMLNYNQIISTQMQSANVLSHEVNQMESMIERDGILNQPLGLLGGLIEERDGACEEVSRKIEGEQMESQASMQPQVQVSEESLRSCKQDSSRKEECGEREGSNARSASGGESRSLSESRSARTATASESEERVADSNRLACGGECTAFEKRNSDDFSALSKSASELKATEEGGLKTSGASALLSSESLRLLAGVGIGGEEDTAVTRANAGEKVLFRGGRLESFASEGCAGMDLRATETADGEDSFRMNDRMASPVLKLQMSPEVEEVMQSVMAETEKVLRRVSQQSSEKFGTESNALATIEACMRDDMSETETELFFQQSEHSFDGKARSILRDLLEDAYTRKAVVYHLELTLSTALKKQRKKLLGGAADRRREMEKTADLLLLHLEVTDRAKSSAVQCSSRFARIIRQTRDLVLNRSVGEVSVEAEALVWSLLIEALRKPPSPLPPSSVSAAH